MGADFVFSYVIFDENTDFIEEKNKILNMIKDTEFDEELVEGLLDDTTIGMFLEEDRDIAEQFIEITNDFFSRIFDENGNICTSRDVSYMFRNKEIIFLTGGMSWGDPPTESCEIFDKFIYMCGSMEWPIGNL